MDRPPCRARSFRAIHQANTVIVIAEGEHPTTGYRVVLEQSTLAVFPPEFELSHVAPTGKVLPVTTPYLVWDTFPAEEPVEHVAVHDRNGRNRVGVERIETARSTSCSPG